MAIKETDNLPIGTQADFIRAARLAFQLNTPLNTLLTINWNVLQEEQNYHEVTPCLDSIRTLVSCLRRWLNHQNIKPTYIWVRENCTLTEEHLHFTFHLPNRKINLFSEYIARHLCSPIVCVSKKEQIQGEVARSSLGGWHLAQNYAEYNRRFQGHGLAIYLGKGEPSERIFRGNKIQNQKKPFNGKTMQNAKYDVQQGTIKGSETRKGRFDMARHLKVRKQARNAV